MPQFLLREGQIRPVESLPLHPADRGLLYGFSLFETMLVLKGRAALLERHLERLTGSAGELGVSLRHAGRVTAAGMTGLLADKCQEVLQRCGTGNGVLRLTVTAGPAEGGEGLILFSLRDGLNYRAEQYEQGFSLVVLDRRRNEKSLLVRHKTANYLENLLGRQEAVRRGYEEGLFLNTMGCVAEGTASNIFVVRHGELVTPPPEAGLLPGTVRRLILEQAAGLGHRCLEADIIPADLFAVQECFLTNSLMGVMPVSSINGKPVGDGRPGPVTRKMGRLYPRS